MVNCSSFNFFQIGGEKFFVDKRLTSQKSMQGFKLCRDIRYGETLHRFRHPNGQHLHVLSLDRPRIGQIQTGVIPTAYLATRNCLPSWRAAMESFEGLRPERKPGCRHEKTPSPPPEAGSASHRAFARGEVFSCGPFLQPAPELSHLLR